MPAGGGLTRNLTDLRSSLRICRSSSGGDGHGNPSDRMGRDPIGACGHVDPSQSCPPIRPTHQHPRRPPGDEPTDYPARRADGDRRRGPPQARPRGRGDRHVGDPPRRFDVCRRLRRLPTADHLGRASRTRRRVRHRGHRQLRGGTRARGRAWRANRPPSRRPRTGRSR